eukprot:4885598-Pyramimonas_sp.AAC.1
MHSINLSAHTQVCERSVLVCVAADKPTGLAPCVADRAGLVQDRAAEFIRIERPLVRHSCVTLTSLACRAYATCRLAPPSALM